MIFFTTIAAATLSGMPGVVPFAVAGRALNERVLVADARLVAGLRDAVDVGAERDHRFAGAPSGDECGRNSGDAALDLEAVLLEDAGEVFRRLDFLHPELAVREDLIDHLLDHLRSRVDLLRGFGLERVELCRARVLVLDGVGGVGGTASLSQRRCWSGEDERGKRELTDGLTAWHRAVSVLWTQGGSEIRGVAACSDRGG